MGCERTTLAGDSPNNSKAKLCTNCFVIFLITTTVVFAGCADENGTGVPSQYSIITGMVTDDSGSYFSGGNATLSKVNGSGSVVQGASVSALWVQPGMPTESISNTIVTDSTGEFSLTCDVTDIKNAIVSATKGGKTWEAVVGATLNLGGTEYCQPLNDQSTVQAEVYKLLAGNSLTSDVTYADIVMSVSKRVAGAVESNSADVYDLAEAITAGEDAWVAAMLNSSVGNASLSTLGVVKLTRGSAQQEFDAALNKAGENQSLASAAFENYIQDNENAYIIEGVNVESVAEITAICSRAEINSLSQADLQLTTSLLDQMSIVTAFSMKSAVHKALKSFFPNQALLDSADTAAASLIDNIAARQTLTGPGAAFNVYHDVIVRLTEEVVGHPLASEIAAIDSTVNSPGGIRATLFNVVSLHLSSVDLVQAYAAFFDSIKEQVSSKLTSVPGPEGNAIAAVLIMTNMEGTLNSP